MTKKILAAMLILVLAASPFLFAENGGAAEENRVDVYYFYGDPRCPTCRKLESYTRETVEKDFKTQVSSGAVVFRPVNVDKKENEHFVKKYKLYTKSVVLSLVRGGKETKYANLEKVWQYVGNKKKFRDYVGGEITKFLGETGGTE